MWMFYVALVAVLSGSLVAFPQNDGGLQNSSGVDGFVFDGPISGNDRSVTTTTTTTTSAITTAASDNAACLRRCPTTVEYNPVCGTDNVVYPNQGSLNCAAVCGKDVRIQHYGPCQTAGARG